MAATKDIAGKALKIGDPVLLAPTFGKVTGIGDDGKINVTTDRPLFPGGGGGKTELTLPADQVAKYSPPK